VRVLVWICLKTNGWFVQMVGGLVLT
jgi:hypothetical protein